MMERQFGCHGKTPSGMRIGPDHGPKQRQEAQALLEVVRGRLQRVLEFRVRRCLRRDINMLSRMQRELAQAAIEMAEVELLTAWQNNELMEVEPQHRAAADLLLQDMFYEGPWPPTDEVLAKGRATQQPIAALPHPLDPAGAKQADEAP